MNWKQKLESQMEPTNRGGRLQGDALIDACHILEIEPKHIAEVGVFRGQTTRQLVKAFPKAALTLVDPWEEQNLPGRMYSRNRQKDWDDIYKAVCEEFAGHTIIRADSMTAAYMQNANAFDLVFLDGDHSYSAVRQDIVMWGDRVRPGGLLCGHDYSTQGNNKGVKKAVDELLPDQIVVGSRKTWIHQIGRA
jgi:predicted O-methyltransferase YrrM